MYRIELSPGEETAFRSIEELAVAIRRNVVTAHARIYHNATSKWLPIQFHPHYKLAVSMQLTQADLVAGPPVAPLSTLKLGDLPASPPAPVSSSREAATQAALAAWPAPPVVTPPAKPVSKPPSKQPLAAEVPITLGTPAPEPRRAREPRVVRPAPVAEPPRAQPPRVVEPVRSTPARAKGSRKPRKSGRSLHLALAGAVLAACAQLLVSAATPGSEMAARVRTPRRLIEAPFEAMKEDSPRTVAGVLPALQTIPLPRKAASSTKPAPKPARVGTAPLASIPEPKSDSLGARSDVLGATVDSALPPEIQPPPVAGDLSGSVPAAPAAAGPKMVDSSGKKALNRILRTIGGTPVPASKTPKPSANR
jgi:hypothetical protein